MLQAKFQIQCNWPTFVIFNAY